MTKRLHHRASRTAWRNQMFWRGMPEIDYALAEYDPTGWPIGKIGALCWHLSSKTKSVCSTGACDLHVRPCLTSEGVSDIVRCRRQKAKLGVNLGVVVKTSGKAAQLTTLHEPRESLIDRRASCNVKEVTRRIDATASGSSDTLHNPIRSRGDTRFHVSENRLYFSDIQVGASTALCCVYLDVLLYFFQSVT